MQNYKAVFSIDLEDGVSIGMKKYFNIESPVTDRILYSGQKVLDTLEKYNVKGTFFVVGNIAKKFPQLIQTIYNQGHEISAHSFSHISYFKLNAKQIKNELKDTKYILEDIIGGKVIGHRAPWLSINNTNQWIMDILIELDYKYDSSFISPKFGKHWYPGYKKEGFEIKNETGKIYEIPISTLNIGGVEIPYPAGSYFRLLPLNFIKYCFSLTLKKQPVIWYIHPYELDTQPQPDYFLAELKTLSFFKQSFIKSYHINRNMTLPKIEALFKRFSFTRIKDLIPNSF